MSKAKKSAKSERTIVRANEFQLVDAKGTIRSMLWADHTGRAPIDLRDARGCPRIHLFVREDGTPHLGLLRDNGSVALGIGMCPFQGTGLAIYDSAGKQILTLEVSPEGKVRFPCNCNEGNRQSAAASKSKSRRRSRSGVKT